MASSIHCLVDGIEMNDIKKGRDSLFAGPLLPSACRSAVILTRRGNPRKEFLGAVFLFVETKLILVTDRPFQIQT